MQIVNTHDVARLARVSRVCGFDIDDLLTEVGVGASESAGPEVHWDCAALARLYAVGMRLSTKAHFPFVLGEYFLFDRAPELDAFVATSSTLFEASLIHPYLPYLMQPDTVLWHEVDGNIVHLYAELQKDGQILDNGGYIETVFVATLHLLRPIVPNVVIQEMSFRHQPFRPLAEYQQQFGDDVQFGSQYNRLSLPKEEFYSSFENTSTNLHAKARELLASRLQHMLVHDSLVKAIEVMILQSPSITMLEVCKRLGIEQRSLQRRLQEEGISFNTLHAHSRFILAKSLLKDQRLDIESIALKLGFSDRNGFTKAFSKWAGIPPGQFRRGVKGAEKG